MKTDQDKTIGIAWWVLAAVIFSLTAAIRVRLLGIPLERDEGEFAYAGQLLLQGIPPYKLAYSMKFPGTYAAYAITMFFFGQTITAIHLGLLFVNSATRALIFFVGKRLVNSTVGIAAAASYALLSFSPSVLGLAAHATHFVVLPVLGGAFLLLNQQNRLGVGRPFVSAGNPFPETIKLAEYVRDHTDPSDTIAVGGSEPQIYFYSHRHSATGYIYPYPRMEAQTYARQMQSEMIHEIESA